ncbi:MAG: transposase [Chloroflexi bacterium]|nr:transposase [Chloroflexota bacterium]MCC6892474.1 transposase [Anaerolineae bacterium]
MSQPTYPQRKSPRLKGHDYTTDGSYFVTICTANRDYLFGDVVEGQMVLSASGHIAAACWLAIPQHYSQVEIDLYVVMPNHVHGMVVLHQDHLPKEKRHHLGRVIGTYKAAATREVNRMTNGLTGNLWQERFHDHIIRNEADLTRIRDYIVNNPALWEQDTFYHKTSS